MARFIVGLMAACLVLAAVPPRAQSHLAPFHIDKLRAMVSADQSRVTIRATVCFRSASEASQRFPDEFRLTHFIVYKRRWTRTWVLGQFRPYIVSFGEGWKDRPCGVVEFRDSVRLGEGFAGFGSRINCYGVEFAIKVGGRRAAKRTTIRCPTG